MFKHQQGGWRAKRQQDESASDSTPHTPINFTMPVDHQGRDDPSAQEHLHGMWLLGYGSVRVLHAREVGTSYHSLQ